MAHLEDEMRSTEMATRNTAANKVTAWMREEAQWYADHSAWPVSDMAEEANRIFDYGDGQRHFSDDWALFMEEKRWKQAERVFKSLKLPMRKDAEE